MKEDLIMIANFFLLEVVNWFLGPSLICCKHGRTRLKVFHFPAVLTHGK